MKNNKNIDQKRLREDFIGKFGLEFLYLMQSVPSGYDGNCWLKFITRKHRKSFHPVRHLLLIYFLCESVDTIYKYANMSFNNVYYPFGKEPYLCLNPAANHYLNSVVTNIKITKCFDTKRPVGTLYC